MLKKTLIYLIAFCLFFLTPLVALATDLSASVTSKTTVVGTGANVINPGEAPIIPGLNYRITGPAKVDNDTAISYAITAIYNPKEPGAVPCEKISITDFVPFGLSILSASGTNTKNGRNVTWKFSENSCPAQDSSQIKNFEFKLFVKPISQDFEAINKIVVEVAP